MCDNFFDDDRIDLEDAAFWDGFLAPRVEGEREEQETGDPSPADILETDLDYLDDED